MTDLPNAASVALIRDGKVLLIQRAYAPYRHLWTLPGGRIEPGETIEACAIREIGEELGLSVATLHPVLVQKLGSDGLFRLAVFASTAFAGTIVPSDEIADHRWVEPAGLGVFRTTARLDDVITKAFAALPQSC